MPGKDAQQDNAESKLEDAIAAESAAMLSEATDESNADAKLALDLETTRLRNDRLKLELDELRSKNKQLKDTRKLRKHYARRALALAEVAVGAWLFFFAFTGITNVIAGDPFLSDNALMTFTAGATVNVLAAFLGIIRGIFPTPGSGDGVTSKK